MTEDHKKETKWFFNGFLLGGLLSGLIVAFIVGITIFKSGSEVGEKTVYSDQEVDILRSQLSPMPTDSDIIESAVPESTYSELGNAIKLGEKEYIVFETLKHREKDLTFRLLSDYTRENQQYISEQQSKLGEEINSSLSASSSSLSFSCFNSDTHLGTSVPVYGSVWDKSGNRLVDLFNIGEIAIESLGSVVQGCVRVLEWEEGHLIVSVQRMMPNESGLGPTTQRWLFLPESKEFIESL